MIQLRRLYANNFKQLQELELHFPAHARVLVQGKNEAGKSTLFEAVFFALFGSALATETGARGLDDLIHYGVEKARVELDVQFGARVFQIKRTIVRGKTNVWELDITRDGEPPEEIRGNTVVNKRLITELGFDGDALLNTCFVEQKKLEKLEGLSRAKREESLAKLLNLDALVALEGDLKIRGEDKQELDRLKKRADLAEIQAELPTHEQQLRAVDEKIKLIELHRAVTGAVAETRAIAGLDAAIHALAAQRDAAAQRVERIAALVEAGRAIKDARAAMERIPDTTREIERLKSEQAEAQRAVQAAPELDARDAALARLERRLKRLDTLRGARDTARNRLAQLAQVAARLDELDATRADAEQSLAQAETRGRALAIGEALGEWIAARQASVTQDKIDDAIAVKKIARDQLAWRLRVETFGWAGALLALAIVGVAAVWFAFALLNNPLLALVLTLAIAALAGLIFIALALRAMNLWRNVSRASEELGQVEGEARAQESVTAAQRKQLEQAQTRLVQFEITMPATIELAQARRDEIARELENKNQDELRADENAAREKLQNAHAVSGELRRQHSIADDVAFAFTRERGDRIAQKAETLRARWFERAKSNAENLGVPFEFSEIQRARFQVSTDKTQVLKRMDDAARLGREIARQEQQAQTHLAQARESYERARAVMPQKPAWRADFSVNDYLAVSQDLRAEYDVLGGEQSLKQARELEQEFGRKQGDREARARNVLVMIGQARAIVGDALSESPELSELETIANKLAAFELGDEAALKIQQRTLVGRVHSLRDRQTQLERDLGSRGEALDRAACHSEWAEKMRATLVRERGVEIVALARRRIVQKVLPATMDYMRRILPALTRDRYHDAQLDADSYKIQVWDERANAFKEKNIFSGGTRDQFSLALRLAFALATMPQERGSAPSFIFLDEPLGSFDDERADALIYLLTEGEIARAFDQIFLISHVHVDERLFTHRVVMENGRIAQTDLPQVSSANKN
jgi:exonuclease SbcC